jgi:uncharacterized membrane protein YfcA
LLVLAAFGAGTVDAIAGGGGLITLPALLAAGLPPHFALATNKGASMWGSGAALFTYARAGQVTSARAPWTFACAALGSAIGAQLVLWVTPAALRPVVIVLLAIAGALMFVRRPPAPQQELATGSWWPWLLLAGGIGAYDGFFGPGTGTFLIVGLVVWCQRTLPRATADAKVINFASNLAAVCLFAWHGQIVWHVALPMALGQLSGGVLGARLAMRGGARLIRFALLGVALALVCKLSWDLFDAGAYQSFLPRP